MPTKPAIHNPAPKRSVPWAQRDPMHLLARRLRDQRRGTAAQRGYGGRWQRVRAAFLASQGHQCGAPGCSEQATVVDHIEPHRGDMSKFWNPDNWQCLCKQHHDQKTSRGE